ncbi:MAG: VWA domain-containing protein [Burkholderiales bacterium]|nr:VWA domain-containing protein [Burkholderiales bacterium]
MLPAELFEDSPDSGDESGVLRWADALRAAALIAVDPVGLGGVALIAQHGPVRERWIALLRSLLPPGTPVRRVPLHVRDDRLIGGLDLSATLQSGRPVAQTGLMVEADGGLLMLVMAERVSESTAARLCAALDTGEVALARDGLSELRPARFGVIALDERIDDDRASNDERLPARLLERLAFHLSLGDVSIGDIGLLDGDADGRGSLSSSPGSPGSLAQAPDIAAARARLMQVSTPDDVMQAICTAALALGVDSLRGSLLALRAARASAALDARDTVSPDDASLAARLVLSPRATRLPAAPPDESDANDEPDSTPEDQSDDQPEPAPDADQPEQTPPPEEPTDNPAENPQTDDDTPPEEDPDQPDPDMSLDELILEAAKASIPAGLLARLAMTKAMASRGAAGGRAGARREGSLRGRPIGTRPGLPRDGARLALIDTLRTAAPWQTLRRREIAASAASSGNPRRASQIEVRASDFRVARVQERAETITIFAVDASGSSALNRLAEAKGAVELLLADCYVRRDKVAVIGFRGRAAEVVLAPTRSLVRAKRGLSGLPGGGGTPLAAGISAATELADATRRRGGTPIIVLLTDGRGNVALDGTGGRARADADARQSARRLRAAGHTALLIDTSPQPQTSARELAAEMGAAYLPLPRADATSMSRSVQAATAASARNTSRGR